MNIIFNTQIELESGYDTLITEKCVVTVWATKGGPAGGGERIPQPGGVGYYIGPPLDPPTEPELDFEDVEPAEKGVVWSSGMRTAIEDYFSNHDVLLELMETLDEEKEHEFV